MQLEPSYIINEQNKKVAVQLDIKTYNKITEVLENYGLYNLMEDATDTEVLSKEDALKYYETLKSSYAG